MAREYGREVSGPAHGHDFRSLPAWRLRHRKARDEVPAVTVPLTGSNAGRSVDSASDRGFRAINIVVKLLQHAVRIMTASRDNLRVLNAPQTAWRPVRGRENARRTGPLLPG